ncbi:hypothetical protein PLEOSDRAFT_21950 [Pleurotus ostreatus PC15]|uniref:Helicase C-terminal domain-containing protein n=1 Tax=Pleurotus ostreatus (strain PC15) TaxID=1137138 RepID=A0A067PAY6_PLEO1|nr:hypothetical protein PLEOSDRAFT_21950 [Pleurotus ostreatus PC15]
MSCFGSRSSFLLELEFLIQKHFVVVTYQLEPEFEVTARVYLVPYDLSNVKGSLRKRPTTVLNPARRYLKTLIPMLSLNPVHWNSGCTDEAMRPFHEPPIQCTLAQIYSNLPSPNPQLTGPSTGTIPKLLDFSFDIEETLGLRSRLYQYQRETVARLIQREGGKASIPDPLYVPIKSVTGTTFFFQPGTYEVLQERPMVVPTTGGILCEELGTGKTIMILALILATRHELSTPEESITDVRPILTSTALRYFPSAPYDQIRQRCGGDRHALKDDDPATRVPSLVELLIHVSRTSPQPATRYSEALESAGLNKLIRATVPFYHHYLGDPTAYERARRDQSRPAPRTIYLTSATLVVVPSNLIAQWYREIHKHCQVELRVLQMRTNSTFPPVKSLASDYDIVLMTYERFTAEERYKNVNKLHTSRTCKCEIFPHTQARIPDCRCEDLPVSPLLQIRWKRLVIDEGHVSSSLNTLLTPFVKLLSIQSKWIVTGTPTTNLLGLSFGSSSIKEQNDDTDDEWKPSNSQAMVRPAEGSICWTKTDRLDLQKFGAMLTHFIGTQQFLSNTNLYKACVIDALMDPDGPRPTAVQVINQLMTSFMVRHRISDIETEITLPPLRTDNILLDLEPIAAKSYNAMQASIVVNAIDSQRTDQDYLFHPRNAASLQLAVANLSQIMFWGTSEDRYNVFELSQNAEQQEQRAIERGSSPQDIQLLREALSHVKAAVVDQTWIASQAHPEIPFQVFDMPEDIFDAWTDIGPASEDQPRTKLMHPLHLTKLKQALLSRPLAPIDWLVEMGHQLHDTEIRDSEKSKKPPGNGIPNRSLQTAAPPVLLRQSPLSRTKIGCSASSKLNYIINEVLQYSPTEKFLIFSQSPLTLAHVKDALDLVHVPYVQFTTQVNVRTREEQVVTFETSETHRVFLMELRHGARGLNLISASRVIFCEPVWQADIESQAIKRVHRIGQTKPVHVKTLVIRDSAEEYMIDRRAKLKGQTSKIPKMLEEQGMRYFIMHPKFISTPPSLLTSITFPFLKFTDELFDVPVDSVTDNAPSTSAESDGRTPLDTPVEKRRRLKFVV